MVLLNNTLCIETLNNGTYVTRTHYKIFLHSTQIQDKQFGNKAVFYIALHLPRLYLVEIKPILRMARPSDQLQHITHPESHTEPYSLHCRNVIRTEIQFQNVFFFSFFSSLAPFRVYVLRL